MKTVKDLIEDLQTIKNPNLVYVVSYDGDVGFYNIGEISNNTVQDGYIEKDGEEKIPTPCWQNFNLTPPSLKLILL